MSKVFNWEYFSYVTLDDAVAYKVKLLLKTSDKALPCYALPAICECSLFQEVLVMPAVIFVLAVVWMQLVKGSNAEESQKEPTQRDINFEQAYQVCILDKSINNIIVKINFQDAKLNEVDSGTELDSQGEDDPEDKEEENMKDEDEKKDD